MHQKIILCDSAVAGVGTVNLDNRSFFLNFEVMTFAIKSEPERSAIALRSLRPIAPDLVESVEKMLLDDLVVKSGL
ncbi:MAG: phospholipase D-like domain-containing protein [Rivularia sp. (in: cyanobacteria)]